tara:strand:+ start:406 stop:753 length:348 start_codon:yes stop_codon:yes gene_type:complete
MANIYCTSCGGKIQYTVSRPKFCGECGEAVASAKPTGTSLASSVGEEEGEEGEELFKKPIQLDYEVSANLASGFTLGGVIGTNQGGQIERRGPGRKINDPLGEAIRDCKSARTKE